MGKLRSSLVCLIIAITILHIALSFFNISRPGKEPHACEVSHEIHGIREIQEEKEGGEEKEKDGWEGKEREGLKNEEEPVILPSHPARNEDSQDPWSHSIRSPNNTTIIEMRLSPFRTHSSCLLFRSFYDGIPVTTWSPLLLGYGKVKRVMPPHFSFSEPHKYESRLGPQYRYSKIFPLCDLELKGMAASSFQEEWRSVYGEWDQMVDEHVETVLRFLEAKNQFLFEISFRLFDHGFAWKLTLDSKFTTPLITSYIPPYDALYIGAGYRFLGKGRIHLDQGRESGFDSWKIDDPPHANHTWRWGPMHPFLVELHSKDEPGEPERIVLKNQPKRRQAFGGSEKGGEELGSQEEEEEEEAKEKKGKGRRRRVAAAVMEAANWDFQSIFFLPDQSYRNVIAVFKKALHPGDSPSTPWQVTLLGHSATDIINHKPIISHLNRPNDITNTSWIVPGKVIRDMRLSTRGSQEVIDHLVTLKGSYLLLDAGWYGPETSPSSDATTWLSTPKKETLDLPEVIRYGRERGIGVFLYVNDIALKRQLPEILDTFVSWGVAGIKFGFVSLESSDDTARILDYVSKCAERHLLVNIHDNYRPSGISRTLPNLLGIEGIRGDEHGPGSLHSLLLPFLRFLPGPADHTYVFQLERLRPMGKTPTHQIALPLVLYSPLQHIFWYADPSELPNDAILEKARFPQLAVWREMPTVWRESRALRGHVGHFLVMARESLQGEWFVAAICHLPVTELSVTFSFLGRGRYLARRYFDDIQDPYSRGWMEEMEVTRETTWVFNLLKGGGEVVQLSPI